MISKKSLEAEKTAVWNELLGGFSAEETEARVEMEKQPPSSASFFFFAFSTSMKIPFSLSFSVAFAAATNCVWHSCPVFSPLGSSLEAWLFLGK